MHSVNGRLELKWVLILEPNVNAESNEYRLLLQFLETLPDILFRVLDVQGREQQFIEA